MTTSQHQLYLADHLKALTVNDLKHICRTHKIKNFSSKKKDELVEMINTFVFESDALKEKMQSDSIYQPFQQEDKVAMDTPDVSTFLFESNGEVVIPTDLKTHLFSNVNPASEQMDLTLFYRAVLNYYGYVSYEAIQKLAQMDGMTKSIEAIQRDLLTLFSDMHDFMDDNGARHPHFDHFKLDLKRAKKTPIVMPESMTTLMGYQTMTMIPQSAQVERFKKFIETNLLTGQSVIIDELIREMRLSEDSARVENYVRRLIKVRRLKKLPLAKYMQVITPVHEEVPVWSLAGGFKEKKVVVKRAINSRVEKKSKKRKKSTNISREK